MVELTTPYFSHAHHCAVCNRPCSQCSTHESRYNSHTLHHFQLHVWSLPSH